MAVLGVKFGMASWEIHLFGPPRVEHENKSIAISRRKTTALLAYLSVELRPHSRDSLAALMWPEHTAAQAKANLRRDLSRLRNILSEEEFDVDRNQVALKPDGNWWLDVREFQDYVQLIRNHSHFPEEYCAECLQAGEDAAQLYDADFMAGFTLPDSAEYDEWQFFTRESLRQSLAELLQRLVGWYTGQGEFEQAIEYGRRWLAMDVLHEPAHRELMQLYGWAGQQAAAIRQYEECVRYLEEELGVAPEPETDALYEVIFARKLPPPTVKKPVRPIQAPVSSKTPPPFSERYETGELLAEGGHGEVYLGRDRVADVPVVIKRIKPELLTAESELLTRFRQEGEILAKLNHPNIVRMLDTFQHQGQYNIVMEYVPGGSLRQLLKKKRQLETAEAMAIGLELADALGRAHHLHIIHRDLKPENILIAEDGTPRLTDFGVAYLKKADSRLTQTGTILGSPDYISPEIVQEGEIDGRSDIWSLGVVLYEMLAGRTPFGSSQIVTVLFNIVNEPETSLLEIRPDLPVHLVNLIHSMLKKEPSDRPASMRQVAAVLEAIQEGRAPEPPAAYLTPPPKAPVPPVKISSWPKKETPHILPRQTTSFVGREEELGKIRRLLVEEASCRLLTLVGPSGIGKTRLAIEAARRLLDDFPDGVYFVSLASIDSADLIIPTIAEKLHFQFSGPATPKAQLIHFLQPKKMLLVADQLEQPLEGGQILSQLLRLVPNISFLVTVRDRLQLTEEWSYEVPGLSLPEKTTVTDHHTLETFSAAHLFIQRARRARADFSLHKDDIATIIEICSLLNCSPLGLEITAPRVRALPLDEILARIKKAKDQVGLYADNGSSDDAGIKAVFSETWLALTTAEQEALRRLTVFQGPCTQEAATEITGASIQTLNALMDKALVGQNGQERYELHNLIRLLAGERLESDPEEYEVIYDIHCRYYLSFLEQQTPVLKIDQAEQILAAMTADIGNFRAAWQWAVRYLLLEDLSLAAQGYWLFHRFQGLLYEGESILRQTAETLINAADEEFDSVAIEQLAGFLKAGQGDLMARRGWLVEGINEIETGLELMRQNEDFDEDLIAFALTALAEAKLEQGFFADARQSAQEALDLLSRRGDLWTRAVCLQLLGSATQSQGQLDTAELMFQACLDICRELGEQSLQLKAKIGLSYIARLRGQYGQSQRWLDEIQALGQSLKNRLNQASVLREQGILALERGQADVAQQNLEASKAVFEAIGHMGGGITEVYLGRYHQLQGDLIQANDYFRLALATAKAANYEAGIAFAQFHIGHLALEQGRLNQAEQYMQDALATWQDLENECLIAKALLGLGDVSVNVGEQRAAEARSYYRQALQLAVKNKLAPVVLKTILGLVPLLSRSGEVHKAIRLLILAEQHPASPFEVMKKTRTYLGSFPEDEVTAVRRETISMDWIETAEALIVELATADWGQKPVHHNLPVHRMVFFGRQTELAEIQGHVLNSNCRLVSIIGPGGIGKTSLAIAAGAELAAHFPQGVFLVSLAPLETADQIIVALAEILGLQNLVTENPKQQLLNYLKRKKMLLIFDNYEHLLPDVGLIAGIVENAPEVQLIVTTRQRLNLGAELVYTLKGMRYPTLSNNNLEMLNSYDAVQLLVGHAELARPEVSLEPDDFEPVVRICNLVEGMPLALVLAANWLDMLSFAEIAEEIAESLDFLESERGDLPPRQRSVRAVFNGSWSRLPEAAQATFARLTVFRGGFTREAARAVCKTSLRDLRVLVNSSFVTVSASGRYEVHELMRQLGAEQLETMGTAENTKTDHSRYYLSYLRQLEDEIRKDGQIEAMQKILDDYDNIRIAWNWAVDRGDREGINQALECLHLFFDYQVRYVEGRALFLKAKIALGPPPESNADLIYARILNRYAFMGIFIDHSEEASKADLKLALEIALAYDDQSEIALNCMARNSYFEDPPNNLKEFIKAEEIYQRLEDNFYLARVYIAIANCYGFLMDQVNGKAYLEKSVQLARKTGDQLSLSLALGNLSEIALATGEYDLASQYIEEAVSYGPGAHEFSYLLAGFNHILAGNLEKAEEAGRKGLAMAEEIGHRYLTAISLAILSIWAGLKGELESGREWAEKSGRIEENNMLGLVLAPWGLFINLARLEHWEEAARALAAAFKQAEKQNLPAPLIWLMAGAALVAAEKGELETAVRFLSISLNHPFQATGWMMGWPRLSGLDAELREKVGEEIFERAWADGVAYNMEFLPSEILASVYDTLQSD